MQYLYLILFLIGGLNHAIAGNQTKRLIDTVLKTPIYVAVQVPPTFPGGINALNEYLENNIKWPDELYRNRINGQMVASFVIEKDGSITDIKIIKDFGYGTGKELERVLTNCIKWNPALQNNKEVRFQYTVGVDLPPPPVSSILIDEPLPEFVLPGSSNSTESLKLPLLRASKLRNMFSKQFQNCSLDTLRFEDEKLVLSDKYSILRQLKESIPPDSLKKMLGRIAFQIAIDTSGTPCLLSYEDNLSISAKALHFDETINTKTKWVVLSDKFGKKAAVTVILVLSFNDQSIKYQHVAFDSSQNVLKELEFSRLGKFSNY